MNTSKKISEKEFEIINVIASNRSTNQRTLAAQTGVSLGLTNLLLKRLVTKGYLRAKQLNARKVHYLLTPQGFAEKARKSYHYTLKTINSLSHLRLRIQALVEDYYAAGERHFVLVGRGDFSDLADMAMRQIQKPDYRYSWLTEWPAQNGEDGLFLISSPMNPSNALPTRSINLLDALSKPSGGYSATGIRPSRPSPDQLSAVELTFGADHVA